MKSYPAMRKTSLIFLAISLILMAGCQTEGTVLTNTTGIEETVFNVGHANRMYTYAETLYEAGRYREAHTAFRSAEMTAYTKQVRQAARMRRMYIEQLMLALEQGQGAPKPPLTQLQKEQLAEAEAERKEEEAQLAARRAEEAKEAAKLSAEQRAYRPLVPNPDPPAPVQPIRSSNLYK